MASDYTAHYNLDKYVATDKPNLRDQYNAAMDKIDAALYSANTDATDAKATANAANQAVSGKASQSDLDALSERLPSSAFDSVNTVAAALNSKASQSDLNTLSAILPSGSFDSTNTVAEALSRKASQSDLNNATSRIATLESRTSRSHLVIIGDSYSSPEHSSDHGVTPWWVTYASQKNLTPHCYARSGIGYVVASGYNTTFYDQAVEAHNDSSFNDADVAEIIVYGGLNDILHGGDLTAYSTAVGTLLNYLALKFPNAKKKVVYGNTQATYPAWINTTSYADLCKIIHDSAAVRGIETFGDTGIYPFCPSMFTGGYGNHPGGYGHKQICAYIISGGKTLPEMSGSAFSAASSLSMTHLNTPNTYMVYGTWEPTNTTPIDYPHNMIFRFPGYNLSCIYSAIYNDNPQMIQIYPSNIAFRNTPIGNSQIGFTFTVDY